MTTTSDRPAGSTLRTLPRRLAGRALARTLRLPAPTTSYTVSSVKIPMRDGVELIADVYEPVGETVGTLLARGPYGRGFPFSLVFADLHAARGYRVVLQSVRGTFGSAGDFVPMAHEAADGADTVEWMRRQPWFTGRFATIGISYLGFTQYALLQDPPPELVTAVITAGPHDLGASAWGTGSFTVNDFLGWCQSGCAPGRSGPNPRRRPATGGSEEAWCVRPLRRRWARPAGRCSAKGLRGGSPG